MQLNRNLTLAIHFVLDRLLPPLLRDSRWFMAPLFWLAFGVKAKYYLTFKSQLHLLSGSEINKFYEILAKTFVVRNTDLNRECVDFICLHVVGESILDVANGKGFMSEKLAQKGYRVTGVDIVQADDAKNSINPLYAIADITQLPFPDNNFDTVICAHTLEHIRDCKQALSEIRRVCKKRLIVVVPCQREYQYTFDLHIHFFPYEYSLRELVGAGGNVAKIGGDFIFTENRS